MGGGGTERGGKGRCQENGLKYAISISLRF